jgi:DNA repair protein RecN (Recombination protein N)
VLLELRVENLLLIERAELRLGPGLNVLTGETGAGKTVLAHSLDLLLGGRARPAVVRPGAAEAYVEGVVELNDALRDRLGDRVAADAEELVLARRLSSEGRSRASINGRSVTVTELRDVAAEAIVFYGQHEHQRLMLASAQLSVLDAACGSSQAARLAECKAAYATMCQAQRRLSDLRELAGARERELGLVEFEIGEIEAVAPSVEEEQDLLSRRDRLRHVDALRRASGAAAEAITADGGGAAETLAAGGGALSAASGLDAALDRLSERWQALLIEARELAADLRAYGESVDEQTESLDFVEDRLAQIDRLKRKHGGSVEAVLEHAASCRERRDELEGAEHALADSEAALAAADESYRDSAARLSSARRSAVPGLEADVRARLADLAMPDAEFAIQIEDREPGPTGADSIEFLLAPNPGVAAMPLRKTASGGELSRVMLALLGSVNTESDAALVFDEIDAGIGGHTARAVGEQLRDLAAGRQVLCITHLPQVAAHAARHFSISKDSTTDLAQTTVTRLDGQQIVAELVRMLGAPADDIAARRHAKELRKAAA